MYTETAALTSQEEAPPGPGLINQSDSPAPFRLAAPQIRVEQPFPLYAVPRIWAWIQEFRWRVSDDFSPATIEEFMALWRATEDSQTRWAVYRDEELSGLVTTYPLSPMIAGAHCLFARRAWGSETTAPALQQVFEQTFASGVHKITATVFRDNKQMIGLARRIGFQKEGVLREQTRRHGKLVDMVVLGLLKESFEKCRN